MASFNVSILFKTPPKIEYGFKNLHDLVLNSGIFLLKIEPTTKGEKILIQLNQGEKTFEMIEN